MGIEGNDNPIVANKGKKGPDMVNLQEYFGPTYKKTQTELCYLKNIVEKKETIKNGIYLRKDKEGKTYKSTFLDGKRGGKKPERGVEVHDIKGKKYQRAREREKTWTPPLKKQTKQVEDTEFIKYLKEKNIIPDIENSTVYYVPIEDGKGHTVKYEAMYIKNDSPSEIIKLPIKDINGKILRYQTIARSIGLKTPMLDPIDIVSIGGGIFMSFAKGLGTLAPKVGINLSKVAIRQISKSTLLLEVLGQTIPKEIMQQFLQSDD